MKRALAALALIATPAHADGWENREIAYQALNAVDVVQTCHIIGSGKGYELNPIFGKHPSCGKLIGVKLAGGVLHYIIADHLRDRDPHAAKIFQIVTLVVQGGVVAANFRLVF